MIDLFNRGIHGRHDLGECLLLKFAFFNQLIDGHVFQLFLKTRLLFGRCTPCLFSHMVLFFKEAASTNSKTAPEEFRPATKSLLGIVGHPN